MKVRRIEHVAITVENLEKVSAMLQDVLGLEAGHVEDMPQYQTKIAMFPIGDSMIELLEGTAPEAMASRFLRERGQGLYHLCFEVDDIEAALAELKGKGVRLLHETPLIGHGGWRVAFIDPSATGNIMIELAEAPAAAAEAHGAAPAH